MLHGDECTCVKGQHIVERMLHNMYLVSSHLFVVVVVVVIGGGGYSFSARLPRLL